MMDDKTIDRKVDSIKNIVDKMMDLKSEILDLKKDLKMEVDELREIRIEAKNTIEKAMHDSHPHLTSLIKKGLAENFSSLKEELTTLSIEFRQKMEGAYRVRESSLTTKGILVTLSFCLGSLLTGAGLWYFFPQHVSVNQTLTDWQMKGLRDGALFKHAFKKLPKKEQESLTKKMWDSYDDWFKEFLDHRK